MFINNNTDFGQIVEWKINGERSKFYETNLPPNSLNIKIPKYPKLYDQMCVPYLRCYRINFVFSFKFNLCLLRFLFYLFILFLFRFLCLPLNLHMNLALISDIQSAQCSRLSSLFIYCVPLIYSVCGNWNRSSLCVLFLFMKSVLVVPKYIFFNRIMLKLRADIINYTYSF